MTKRKKMSSPASPVNKQVSDGKGEISEEIGGLKDYIKEELGKLKEEFKGWSEARLAAVEQAVEFALDSVAAVSAKVSTAESEAKRAISELETVSRRLRQLEDLSDNAEQNSRLDLLIFSGKAVPKSQPGENCAVIVRKLLKEHMGYQVKEEQINRAHRIQSGKIVVKFNRTGPGSDKDQVWKRRIGLKGKDLFVQESLTERRQEIFQALLQARRDGKIFSAFTQGGKVFYKHYVEDFPHRASSMEAVLALVREPHAARGGDLQGREQEHPWEVRRPAGESRREAQPERTCRPRPAWTERGRVPPDAGRLGSPLAGVGRSPGDRSAAVRAAAAALPPGTGGPPRTDDVTLGGRGAAAAAVSSVSAGALGRSAGDVTPVRSRTATSMGSAAEAGDADVSALAGDVLPAGDAARAAGSVTVTDATGDGGSTPTGEGAAAGGATGTAPEAAGAASSAPAGAVVPDETGVVAPAVPE